jgi:hypothetical protein
MSWWPRFAVIKTTISGNTIDDREYEGRALEIVWGPWLFHFSLNRSDA